MIRFIRLLIVVLVTIILVLFAFANRQWVAVSFDPFGSPEQPRPSRLRRPCSLWCSLWPRSALSRAPRRPGSRKAGIAAPPERAASRRTDGAPRSRA